MFGGLVGRATSAFLILRREDPQKVPEPRGRKQQESQAPGVGAAKWGTASPKAAAPPEPRQGRRQESRLSPRALQPLPGSFTRVPFPQWRSEPSASPDPRFSRGPRTGRSLGARVPVRDFSRGKKRPETLL